MGYSSKVAISMYEKDFKKMIEAVLDDKNNLDIIWTLKHAELYKSSLTDNDDNVITLYWNSTKWYDDKTSGFVGVNFIMDYIGREYDDSREIPVMFCRVGEDFDDVELYSHNDDRGILGNEIGISTEIMIYDSNRINSVGYIDRVINRTQIEPIN